MKPTLNPDSFVPLGVYRPRFLLFYMSKIAKQLHSTLLNSIQQEPNPNLSPVQRTHALGVILDTKQPQKPKCERGLIPFKPTKEEETTLHFWKDSHSF